MHLSLRDFEELEFQNKVINYAQGFQIVAESLKRLYLFFIEIFEVLTQTLMK